MVKVTFWTSPKNSYREVSLASKVLDVKQQLFEETGICLNELEVVFCGRKLPNDSVLSSFDGIREHSTIHVLRRKVEKTMLSAWDKSSFPLDSAVIEALVTSFQTALMDQQHRTLLFSIISNSEGLSSLISANAGLKEDTVAQGILKDPYLLMHWLTSEKVKELIEEHPSLVEAGQQIMSSLHQEAAGMGSDQSVILFQDQGSDDEQNSDGEEGGNQPEVRAPITADQLAAALAAAGAPAATRNMAPSPSGVDAGGGGEGGVTPDAFQQALLQALRVQPAPQQQQPQQHNEGMERLKDMGFTNEAENTRVLRAAGGNFEAALELIISERERMMEEGMGLD